MEDPSHSSTIEPGAVSGSGIIFVRTNDPISHFIMGVGHLEYSLIGYYYETMVTGYKKIEVVVIDFNGVEGSKWIGPLSLQTLVSCPSILRVSIRSLRYNDVTGESSNNRLQEYFRSLILSQIRRSPSITV